jgi:MOSC domain
LRVLSVNVSLPRDVVWRGKTIRTGIYKEPVAGRVPLRRTNLDGDRQADLRVHGGPDKAVCAYPSEHYELWSRERPELLVRPGAFGENLTTDGLVDDDSASATVSGGGRRRELPSAPAGCVRMRALSRLESSGMNAVCRAPGEARRWGAAKHQ